MKQILTVLICSSFLFAPLPFTPNLAAQTETVSKDVTGIIGDASTRQGLADVEVELLYFKPKKFTTTDSKGNFTLYDIPAGRHRIMVRAKGYEETIIDGVVISSGRTPYLRIYIEEAAEATSGNATDNLGMPDVKVKKNKILTRISDHANNGSSDVSARSISMDEVNRFSGARGDIARLTTGFPGVINLAYIRYDIISRWATPLGLQWRLEGMAIENPNHLGYFGTSAGWLPIININMMDNSDFLYGNISAEYGNSTSGTFDVNLRKGSTEKLQATAQVAMFNGAELMLEGPFRPGGNTSFVIAARYSVMRLAFMSGVSFGVNSVPDYFDANFNIYIADNKNRQISLFGIYGNSSIFTDFDSTTNGDFISTEWNRETNTKMQFGTIGLKYREILSEATYWQSTVGATGRTSSRVHRVFERNLNAPGFTPYTSLDEQFTQFTYNLNSFVNTKFSRRFSMRTGVTGTLRQTSLNSASSKNDSISFQLHDYEGFNGLMGGYVQAVYKFSNKLKTTLGLYGQYSTINKAWSLEPRFSLTWEPNKRNRFSLGYAWQSSELPLPIYYHRTEKDGSGNNLSLDFIRNHYITLEYSFKLGETWQMDLMPYFRYWSSVPVGTDTLLGLSFINFDGEGMSDNYPNALLTSAGTALNYGIDLNLKKIFSHGYYMVLNASFLNASYKGIDGVKRNSRFNKRYIGRLLGGKEFMIGKQKNNTFFINSTISITHGGYDRPIDLVASINLGDEVYTDEWYTNEIPLFFQWDLQFGMRLNGKNKKVGHYFYFDFINVLNRKNVSHNYYDGLNESVHAINHLGFLPGFVYRVQF